MKKLLVALASIMLTASMAQASAAAIKEEGANLAGAYKQANPYAAPAVAVLTTPLGKTIEFGSNAWSIVMKHGTGVIENVVDAGKCTKTVGHPGELFACGVDMGGHTLAIIPEFAGAQAENATKYFVDVVTSLDDAFVMAFDACAADLGNVYGAPCKVVAVTLDSAGQLVSVVGGVTADGLGNMGSSGAGATLSFFDISSSALRGDVEGIWFNAVRTTAYLACMGGQLPAGLIRIITLGMVDSPDCAEHIKNTMLRPSDPNYKPIKTDLGTPGNKK